MDENDFANKFMKIGLLSKRVIEEEVKKKFKFFKISFKFLSLGLGGDINN